MKKYLVLGSNERVLHSPLFFNVGNLLFGGHVRSGFRLGTFHFKV